MNSKNPEAQSQGVRRLSRREFLTLAGAAVGAALLAACEPTKRQSAALPTLTPVYPHPEDPQEESLLQRAENIVDEIDKNLELACSTQDCGILRYTDFETVKKERQTVGELFEATEDVPVERQILLVLPHEHREQYFPSRSWDEVSEEYKMKRVLGQYGWSLETITMLFHLPKWTLLTHSLGGEEQIAALINDVFNQLKEREKTYDSPSVTNLLASTIDKTTKAASFLNQVYKTFLAAGDFKGLVPSIPTMPVSPSYYEERVGIAPKEGVAELSLIGGLEKSVADRLKDLNGVELTALILRRNLDDLKPVLENPQWEQTKEGQNLLKGMVANLILNGMLNMTEQSLYYIDYCKFDYSCDIANVCHQLLIEVALRKVGFEAPNLAPKGALYLYDILVEAFKKQSPSEAENLAIDRLIVWSVHPHLIHKEIRQIAPEFWSKATASREEFDRYISPVKIAGPEDEDKINGIIVLPN